MSKSGSSIQYGMSSPNGTVTSRRRYGSSWSIRDRIARLVISNPAPPVPGGGSKMVIDETCPYIEPVSMFKKLASMPPSCFMRRSSVELIRIDTRAVVAVVAPWPTAISAFICGPNHLS